LAQYRHSKLIEHTNKKMTFCIIWSRRVWTKKCVYKYSMLDWFKKVEILASMAIVKNNIISIEKSDKLLLYVPFEIRQRLLFVVHGDLLMGHSWVKKFKERLMECYFWLNMTRTS
jgi:hypothetical protein